MPCPFPSISHEDYKSSRVAEEVNVVYKFFSPEGLLNTTNNVNDRDSPSEYMIVYITVLRSGLLRVHITCQSER